MKKRCLSNILRHTDTRLPPILKRYWIWLVFILELKIQPCMSFLMKMATRLNIYLAIKTWERSKKSWSRIQLKIRNLKTFSKAPKKLCCIWENWIISQVSFSGTWTGRQIVSYGKNKKKMKLKDFVKRRLEMMMMTEMSVWRMKYQTLRRSFSLSSPIWLSTIETTKGK